MTARDARVPRMLGDHGEARPVTVEDVEQWIAAGAGGSVSDEVVTLLMVAAAQHEQGGRPALAASLRQHACELLRPPGGVDARLRLVDDLLDRPVVAAL